MTARMVLARRILPLFVFTSALGCISLSPAPLVMNAMVWRAGQADGYPVITGDYLQPGRKQAVIFGAVGTESGWYTPWSFFVLVKGHGGTIILRSVDLVNNGDNEGHFRELITIGPKEMSLEYKVVSAPFGEFFQIGEEAYDLESGRVFLVDLSGDFPAVSQIQADFGRDQVRGGELREGLSHDSLFIIWGNVRRTLRRLMETIPIAGDFESLWDD